MRKIGKDGTIAITTRLEPSTVANIRAIARARGITVTALMRNWLQIAAGDDAYEITSSKPVTASGQETSRGIEPYCSMGGIGPQEGEMGQIMEGYMPTQTAEWLRQADIEADMDEVKKLKLRIRKIEEDLAHSQASESQLRNEVTQLQIALTYEERARERAEVELRQARDELSAFYILCKDKENKA